MYNDSVGVGMAFFVYLVMFIGNFTYVYIVFLPVYQAHYGDTVTATATEVQTDPPYRSSR